MKKIIIFKTDRIGDFVYFSPCLKNLKDNFKNKCEITVVCGKYNYQIVKYEKHACLIYIELTIKLTSNIIHKYRYFNNHFLSFSKLITKEHRLTV